MGVYVTSLGRPTNVPAMNLLAGGVALTWLVPDEEADAYLAAGAGRVITGPPGKCEKINAILDAHGDEWCVFSDDDCRSLTYLTTDGRYQPCSLTEAAMAYVTIGSTRKDHYVGIPNFSNVRFATRKVTNWGSTVGWFCAIAPDTPCRFDPSLIICHDVEYAAQCFDRYGRISRIGWIIGDYRYADKASHFTETHADREPGYRELIRRYPHLFYWKGGQALGFRRVT